MVTLFSRWTALALAAALCGCGHRTHGAGAVDTDVEVAGTGSPRPRAGLPLTGDHPELAAALPVSWTITHPDGTQRREMPGIGLLKKTH